MPIASSIQVLLAAIANGASLSGEIDCGMNRVVRISMPAAFTGASISFQTPSAIDGTYQSIYKEDGTLYSVTVAASKDTALDTTKFIGVTKFKILSAGVEAADRVIGCVLV